MKTNISSFTWKITKCVCLTFTILQTGLNIQHRFFSGRTITSVSVKNFDQVDFPFFLSVFVRPGFDTEKLKEKGYESVYDFFLGKKRNASTLGWLEELENLNYRSGNRNISKFTSMTAHYVFNAPQSRQTIISPYIVSNRKI